MRAKAWIVLWSVWGLNLSGCARSLPPVRPSGPAPAESCAVSAVRSSCGADEARGLERLHAAYVEASTGRDLALIDLESCLASGERAARVEAADAGAAAAELAACRAASRDGPPWWTVPVALVVGAAAGAAAVAF